MAITVGLSTQASGSTNSPTATALIPSDATTGDTLIALVTTSGSAAITAPAGWTEISTGVMLAGSTGSWSLVRRTMASGVTQVQWAVGNETATGLPATKLDIAVTTFKGVSTVTAGAVSTRSTGGFTTDVSGVTDCTDKPHQRRWRRRLGPYRHAGNIWCLGNQDDHLRCAIGYGIRSGVGSHAGHKHAPGCERWC
jgi:hypothetical protein